MAILGLANAESYSTERYKSVRRSVFYWYPQGAAPLMGLLSLLKDESCDDPEFGWWEKRHKLLGTTLANISSTVVIYTRDAGTGGTYTTASGNVSVAKSTTSANTWYGFKVTDASVFRVNHQFKAKILNSSAAEIELQGIITEVDTTNNRITFWSLTTATIDYDGANAGKEILVIGNSAAEGQSNNSSGRNTIPTKLTNYTQIFRTPFEVTGTALKTSLMYDKEGPYNDLAKENSVNNMIEMEFAFLFGEKNIALVTVPGTSLTKYQRTTGGVLYWMGLWEAGTSYGETAVSAITDENARIINFDSYSSDANVLTDVRYDDLLQKAFRRCNNKANEKLVLCGDGYLGVVNRLYKSIGVLNNEGTLMDGDFGMNVVSHRTPWGWVHYKTHPLFSQNASMRYNALFMDVNNLKYTYLEGRDTELLTGRQDNSADTRIDEWLGECGLEFRMPESFMYLKNVTSAG